MSDTTELTVLKMLATQRRTQFIATALGIGLVRVLDIARTHGALRDGEVDPIAAGHAAAELMAATGSIPVRDRQPVKQHGAPRVRVNGAAEVTSPGKPFPPKSPTRPDGDEHLLDIAIDDIHPDPDNPRTDLDDIPELAASLNAVGMLQPIVVRRAAGRLVVVMGHRRLAAARHAGWKTVKVIIRGSMRSDDVLAAMLVENGHRRDLDPIEEARALRRLQVMHGNCSHAVLGAKVGRHQTHVSARLALLDLSAEDQDAVRLGTMRLGDAIRRGRENAGRARPDSPGFRPHLGVDHALARHASARCRRLEHSLKGGNSVGGVACGACWESVIRADERQHLHTHAARTGTPTTGTASSAWAAARYWRTAGPTSTCAPTSPTAWCSTTSASVAHPSDLPHVQPRRPGPAANHT